MLFGSDERWVWCKHVPLAGVFTGLVRNKQWHVNIFKNLLAIIEVLIVKMSAAETWQGVFFSRCIRDAAVFRGFDKWSTRLKSLWEPSELFVTLYCAMVTTTNLMRIYCGKSSSPFTELCSTFRKTWEKSGLMFLWMYGMRKTIRQQICVLILPRNRTFVWMMKIWGYVSGNVWNTNIENIPHSLTTQGQNTSCQRVRPWSGKKQMIVPDRWAGKWKTQKWEVRVGLCKKEKQCVDDLHDLGHGQKRVERFCQPVM